MLKDKTSAQARYYLSFTLKEAPYRADVIEALQRAREERIRARNKRNRWCRVYVPSMTIALFALLCALAISNVLDDFSMVTSIVFAAAAGTATFFVCRNRFVEIPLARQRRQ